MKDREDKNNTAEEVPADGTPPGAASNAVVPPQQVPLGVPQQELQQELQPKPSKSKEAPKPKPKPKPNPEENKESEPTPSGDPLVDLAIKIAEDCKAIYKGLPGFVWSGIKAGAEYVGNKITGTGPGGPAAMRSPNPRSESDPLDTNNQNVAADNKYTQAAGAHNAKRRDQPDLSDPSLGPHPSGPNDRDNNRR